MLTTSGNRTPHIHHVRLDRAGRIVVPAEMRHQLGVDAGDTLVLRADADSIRLLTMNQVIKETQEYFRQFIPEGVSLVDELIAERRAEALRE